MLSISKGLVLRVKHLFRRGVRIRDRRSYTSMETVTIQIPNKLVGILDYMGKRFGRSRTSFIVEGIGLVLDKYNGKVHLDIDTFELLDKIAEENGIIVPEVIQELLREKVECLDE